MAKDLKESGSSGSKGRMKRIVERYNTTDDSGKKRLLKNKAKITQLK